MAGKALPPSRSKPSTQADSAAPNNTDEAAEITELSYEQAFAELETLVDSMESGELTLEASVAAYQRGAALATHCQLRLQAAEVQVKMLEEGLLKPFSAASPGSAS